MESPASLSSARMRSTTGLFSEEDEGGGILLIVDVTFDSVGIEVSCSDAGCSKMWVGMRILLVACCRGDDVLHGSEGMNASLKEHAATNRRAVSDNFIVENIQDSLMIDWIDASREYCFCFCCGLWFVVY